MKLPKFHMDLDHTNGDLGYGVLFNSVYEMIKVFPKISEVRVCFTENFPFKKDKAFNMGEKSLQDNFQAYFKLWTLL